MSAKTIVSIGSRWICAALLAAAVALLPGEARAQGPGVQAGLSASPNQFYAGVHYELGPVVEQLMFRPNFELGVGSHETLAAFNLEFAYRLTLPQITWRLYVGGGPALGISSTHGETHTGGGLNLLVGARHPGGLFVEVKVGFGQSPVFKAGVGYTFGR